MESDPDIGAPDGDRLDVLATLVQAYEAKHFPIDLPDPIEAIKFRMEHPKKDLGVGIVAKLLRQAGLK